MSGKAAAKHRKREEKLKLIRREETARRNELANRSPAPAQRMGNDSQTLKDLSGALGDMMHKHKESYGRWKETGKLKEEGHWEYVDKFKNDAARILRLLDEVKDVESRHNGKTALMIVCEMGFTALAKLLIEERNASVEAKRTKTNETALILAAKNGRENIVGYLLEKKADPNAQDSEGWTALMFASISEQRVEVMEALRAKANHGLRNGCSETALMIAATHASACVRRLLDDECWKKAKETVDMQDKDGRTALMKAGIAGSPYAINCLVERKAGLNLQDKDGLTALDHVEKNRGEFEYSLWRGLRKRGAKSMHDLKNEAQMRASGVSERTIAKRHKEQVEFERMKLNEPTPA